MSIEVVLHITTQEFNERLIKDKNIAIFKLKYSMMVFPKRKLKITDGFREIHVVVQDSGMSFDLTNGGILLDTRDLTVGYDINDIVECTW